MLNNAVPEQGQLVNVRRHKYAVSDVQASTLPADPLRGITVKPYHLITLSSVEDDALGEELQVIWELEPGAQPAEEVSDLEITGFDTPERLDAFLNAVRWGAISSTDVRSLQSPFRSGIVIEPYQLDPVARAIQMPRVNLLIADDVGLGKTIEAGLVAQELILRYRVRKVLVVCPSSLQIQWRDQMRDKFGLEFHIVDSKMMKDLRRERGLQVNPWTHYPRLITSIDFLKRDRSLRLFREVLPAEGEPVYPRRFDLLIVDEAHNVAPSGRGKYATDSGRTAAIRLLGPHFEHKLFLSATPHNGYPESFTALLEMLDSQRFARGVAPAQQQLAAIMVRRLKSELRNWDQAPRFAVRKLAAIEIDYNREERDVHQLLQAYTLSRRKSLNPTTDEVEAFATEFVLKLLKKRLFSSPEAFALTLAQHERSLREARRYVTAKPKFSVLQNIFEQVDEEFDKDEDYSEATTDALDEATRLFRPPTAEEQALLDQMRGWAEEARVRADSKAREMIGWLKRELKPGGVWSDKRVIIFTEYRDTQRWLLNLLTSEGLGGGRLKLLHGGLNSDEREKIKAAFQASPDTAEVRILLATDAASEGIDLQNYCSRLIHYEIPWNPNRMEQRNGRIDRHGQRANEVLIYHFVTKGYAQRRDQNVAPKDLDGDLEFLMRAAEKVDRIREDLGKVGQVIALQVEAAMLGRYDGLISDAEAHRQASPVNQLLKFQEEVRERVEKLYEKLEDSKRSLNIEPANIQQMVETALQLAGQPPLKPEAVPGGVAYRLPQLGGSWAESSEGLRHPYDTERIRPVVFDHKLAEGRDDVVLMHLNSRLVQMAMRLLRAEVWSVGSSRALHRFTARVVPDGELSDPAVVIHARLMLTGGDNRRLHEEVVAAGGRLREGRFARLGTGDVDRILRAQTTQPVPASLQQRLIEMWPGHRAALIQSLEARRSERTDSLTRQLAERADKEAQDISAVMQELLTAIRLELKQMDGPQQLGLFQGFDRAEQSQFEENRRSLSNRLTEIPQELESEVAAIRARFADIHARVFPVAVTYLVPEREARRWEER